MANYVENTKARFNYEILDEYEAGIELLGSEVKSLRQKHGRIESSHVIVRGGEAFLVGMDLPPYQPMNTPDYDPLRNRKILLTRGEIATLAGLGRNLTIVPITLYNKGRKIKIEIATVKGKKQFDKRETVKKRDTDRSIKREFGI